MRCSAATEAQPRCVADKGLDIEVRWLGICGEVVFEQVEQSLALRWSVRGRSRSTRLDSSSDTSERARLYRSFVGSPASSSARTSASDTVPPAEVSGGHAVNELGRVSEHEVIELGVNGEHVYDRSATAGDQRRLLLMLDAVDDRACVPGKLADADRAHGRAPSMCVSMYAQHSILAGARFAQFHEHAFNMAYACLDSTSAMSGLSAA
jgi:hypothetical protein